MHSVYGSVLWGRPKQSFSISGERYSIVSERQTARGTPPPTRPPYHFHNQFYYYLVSCCCCRSPGMPSSPTGVWRPLKNQPRVLRLEKWPMGTVKGTHASRRKLYLTLTLTLTLILTLTLTRERERGMVGGGLRAPRPPT